MEKLGFHDRREAGLRLAEKLTAYHSKKNALVLALPRGGVPVAFELARALKLPFDVFPVRKLGVPGHEELAMGAIAMGGECIFNHDIIRNLEISDQAIDREVAREIRELERRNKEYRGGRPFPAVKNKSIILVDDGLATGATMRAAIAAMRAAEAKHIIVAVPVGVEDVCRHIGQEADKVITVIQPHTLYGVGQWYHNFEQLNDRQVHAYLELAEQESHAATES